MQIKNTRRGCGLMMKAGTILIFLATIPPTFEDLIEQPENTAVLLNTTTTIKCKSDEGRKLQWHVLGNNSQEEELWTGYFFNPEASPCSCYKMDSSEPGKYNLNIQARRETAKRYRCTEPGSLMSRSAVLIVVEALNCTHSNTTTEVTLSCVVGVHGEWIPQINWTKGDEVQMNAAVASEKNGKVSSKLTIPLTNQEVSFTVTLYFDARGRPAELTATNVPSYVDKWTSSSFKATVSDNSDNISTGLIVGVCCGGVIVVTAAAMGLAMKSKLSRKKTGDVSSPEKNETCEKLNQGTEDNDPEEKKYAPEDKKDMLA